MNDNQHDNVSDSEPVDPGVVITPFADLGEGTTTIRICGLEEGSHIVLSIPGAHQEQHLFIGKHGQVHAFGFGEPSDRGPIRISNR